MELKSEMMMRLSIKAIIEQKLIHIVAKYNFETALAQHTMTIMRVVTSE